MVYTRLLEGLIVLNLAEFVASAFRSRILADMGGEKLNKA